MKPRRNYLEGEIVGGYDIVFLNETDSRRYGKFNLRYANFKCHCGKIFEANISAVKRGHTSSCGCIKLKMFINYATIHGMYQSFVYKTWLGIKARTERKKTTEYENYGGRGIIMFPPWIHDFQLFKDYISCLEHYGEKGYTIDRINTNGNYEPGNLRWASRHIQGANQRKQKDNTSGYTGVCKTRKRWCSHIVIMRKWIHLGCFNTPKDAARARNDYIIKNALFEYPIQEIKI